MLRITLCFAALSSLPALAQDVERGLEPGPLFTLEIRPNDAMCIAGPCPGWWYRSVENPAVRCANGEVADRCFAIEIDFSQMALTFGQEQWLLRSAEGGVYYLIAEIEPAQTHFGQTSRLVVHDAERVPQEG